MKKLSIILGLMLLFGSVAYCEEVQTEQTVKNNQTYFTANLQKQPQETGTKQGIGNHFTFFTINVQINGKVKDSANNNIE